MGILDDIRAELQSLRDQGLYKDEAPLTTAQAAHVGTLGGEVINLCANNYLGLADSPELIAAAKDALDRWGFGMASVRFICGTQTQHQELESKLTGFLRLGQPGFDTILYSSCFDANGGLFETLLTDRDAIISDELNHASIIDGVRLSKAARYRYRNADMADLAAQLEAARAAGARHTLIATDGVFSMDGYVAPLDRICALADEYGALVMVDDSHAVGFMGETGAGTPELFGVADRVDILTGTLGKALGGASARVHVRPRRDGGAAAAAFAPVPVQQLVGAVDHGGGDRRHRSAGREARPADEAAGEHGLLPAPDRRGGFHGAGVGSPDRAGDAG